MASGKLRIVAPAPPPAKRQRISTAQAVVASFKDRRLRVPDGAKADELNSVVCELILEGLDESCWSDEDRREARNRAGGGGATGDHSVHTLYCTLFEMVFKRKNARYLRDVLKIVDGTGEVLNCALLGGHDANTKTVPLKSICYLYARQTLGGDPSRKGSAVYFFEDKESDGIPESWFLQIVGDKNYEIKSDKHAKWLRGELTSNKAWTRSDGIVVRPMHCRWREFFQDVLETRVVFNQIWIVCPDYSCRPWDYFEARAAREGGGEPANGVLKSGPIGVAGKKRKLSSLIGGGIGEFEGVLSQPLFDDAAVLEELAENDD